MKKLKTKVSNAIAKTTYRVAVKGAGLASWGGWYQPKVPERLAK